MKRRSFIKNASAAALSFPAFSAEDLMTQPDNKKKKVAIVGLGSRGTTMWGMGIVNKYKEHIQFVGLCDINPGRLKTGKELLKVNCPTYTDFKKMMLETKPDMLIVTTVDATHHEFIIEGMKMGADIITEKPMTTDETKCQAILDTQKATGRKVTVTFNYRYSPHRQKLWELLRAGSIGKLTSVDFHWYLDTRHGADYFRRWHAFKEKSGSLLVHKSSHHFDLLNWWLEAEPVEVFAKGSLEFYGKNGKQRGKNCRTCEHKSSCPFYWDISKNTMYTKLYTDHEQHDGYLRDGCVFREDINIYDKMAAVITYSNGVQASYSLTTYSPYEGYRISFNGTEGRIDAWVQESGNYDLPKDDEIIVYKNFGKVESIKIPQSEGHGGGDDRLRDFIFVNPNAPDTYKQSAGVREGAMAILTGVAARKSIETGKAIKIGDLTNLKPGKKA
jgi:predicted dehydrogenase